MIWLVIYSIASIGFLLLQQDAGAGAAVPAEGEAAGGAEVLPERPQAHIPEGPVRRHHVRRHPPRPGSLQLVPHRKQIWHLASLAFFSPSVLAFETCGVFGAQGRGVYNMSHGIGKKE